MRRIIIACLLCGTMFADELLRPTTDTTGSGAGCFGVSLATSSLPLARDAAGSSTSSTIDATSEYIAHGGFDLSRTSYSSRRITSWPATANTYVGLTLNILSSSPGATGTGGNACLAYSINSGGLWTSIRCSASAWTMVTDSIVLTPAQDLTKLQVAVCVQANGNDPANTSFDLLRLYDIWTLGTNTPQGAGNGSTAGQPHRGLVIAN